MVQGHCTSFTLGTVWVKINKSGPRQSQMYLNNDLTQISFNCHHLDLGPKTLSQGIAYFYFYSTIQVKFLGRLDHGKRDVFRTNEIGQRGMNNLIKTNTAPTEPGPMVLLVLFTDSNQFYSQQNMKIQYKLQSQLYAGCSFY